MGYMNTPASSSGGSGDITSVVAGAGLTGGATTGDATVNVVGGDGITANANEVEVTVDDSTIELSASDGSGAIRVKDSGVTLAKLANIADDRVLGNVSGGSAAPSALTAANLRTLINVEDGADVTDATNVAAAGALMRTATINTNASPQASAADSGEYFYITSGSFTLPDITSVGEQYVVLNNTGSSLSIGKHASDTTIPSSPSIDDDKAATIVAVTSSTWFVVG